MIKDHPDSTETNAAWDHFLSTAPGGHHEQSSHFAAERAQSGFAYRRIVCLEAGEVIGGAQVLLRKMPGFGRIGSVFRGPVVQGNRPETSKAILEGLDQLAKRERLVLLSVHCLPGQDETLSSLDRHGYQASSSWFEGEGLAIPLDQTEDQILSVMKPKGRYNIRLAQRRNVIVKQADEESIPIIYELHQQTAAYQGFPIFPQEYFASMAKMFGLTRKFPAFVCWHEGVPIAAIVNLVVDGRMYYGWGGMSRDPDHRKLMGNYLLHWEAIQWGRDHGVQQYELGGANDFKVKIGTAQVRWPDPRRKFFGALSSTRRLLFDGVWKIPRLRHRAQSLQYRLIGPLAY